MDQAPGGDANGMEDQFIQDRELAALLRERLGPLQSLLACLVDAQADAAVLTRRLIGRLLLEASQTEALLDEYGAGLNRRWRRFRELMAALKCFAGIAQGLAHLDRRLPAYRLLAAENDFPAATKRYSTLVGQVLLQVAVASRFEAQELDILAPASGASTVDYLERFPPGRLPRDIEDRYPGDAVATNTRLATEFLNLEASGEFLHDAARVAPSDYAACFPQPISEERLRALTFRFHNLQSLYDTHVAGTSIERMDENLGFLRGHVSVILHLLQIATDLAHYYERHVRPGSGDAATDAPDALVVMKTDTVMGTLFSYAAVFASAYLMAGQRLCHDILRRYAEIGHMEVPLPAYRGFHVRPSNLVARIVHHYGSEVRMELAGQVFDAASPLELFRANEGINAHKRRWLATELARVAPAQVDTDDPAAIAAAVASLISRLAGDGKIVIYRQPLEFSEEAGRRDGGVLGNATAEIAHLQASGQIDIRTDLTVAFVGDKRVLEDVDLLARHGYGEDAFGNNVVLPPGLAYLRR